MAPKAGKGGGGAAGRATGGQGAAPGRTARSDLSDSSSTRVEGRSTGWSVSGRESAPGFEAVVIAGGARVGGVSRAATCADVGPATAAGFAGAAGAAADACG